MKWKGKIFSAKKNHMIFSTGLLDENFFFSFLGLSWFSLLRHSENCLFRFSSGKWKIRVAIEWKLKSCLFGTSHMENWKSVQCRYGTIIFHFRLGVLAKRTRPSFLLPGKCQIPLCGLVLRAPLLCGVCYARSGNLPERIGLSLSIIITNSIGKKAGKSQAAKYAFWFSIRASCQNSCRDLLFAQYWICCCCFQNQHGVLWKHSCFLKSVVYFIPKTFSNAPKSSWIHWDWAAVKTVTIATIEAV